MDKNKTLLIIFTIFCITCIIIFIIDQAKYHPYDVNHDGTVNITDYAVIKDYIKKNNK